MARAQVARVHECQALVTRARVLRSVVGVDAAKNIADDLAAADIAIEEVGAHAWSRFVHEERARLARLDMNPGSVYEPERPQPSAVPPGRQECS